MTMMMGLETERRLATYLMKVADHERTVIYYINNCV
jgi:hypothetical protein